MVSPLILRIEIIRLAVGSGKKRPPSACVNFLPPDSFSTPKVLCSITQARLHTAASEADGSTSAAVSLDRIAFISHPLFSRFSASPDMRLRHAESL